MALALLFLLLPGGNLLGGGRLPDLGGLIQTASDNPLAFRGKGHNPNLSDVSLERE